MGDRAAIVQRKKAVVRDCRASAFGAIGQSILRSPASSISTRSNSTAPKAARLGGVRYDPRRLRRKFALKLTKNHEVGCRTSSKFGFAVLVFLGVRSRRR
jgi:hypothetical protein